MCYQCDYRKMLQSAELNATANRLRILEVVGSNNSPLSASQIFNTLERTNSINRVTVYRILELLVRHRIMERISTGGRAFYYGLAPNTYHQRHPHFYCKHCGQMDCLDPESLNIETERLWKTFPGKIDRVEIRVDGVCKNCMNQKRSAG